jgi:septal ring factor EnvC (AmiA/AmiB activator)
MPEPTDAIMPILQRIQADIADVKKDVQRVDGKVDGVSGQVAALAERMDAFEDYFTFTMGLTQRNTADIKRMRSQIAAIDARLSGPDSPR